MKKVTSLPPLIDSSSLTPKSTPLYFKGGPSTPAVYYTTAAWNVIWYLVHEAKKEIGWLGLVEQVGNDYLITDIYVPEQTVSYTETDIKKEAIEALAMEIFEQGKDPSNLRYWGHSHVHMGVTPSNQDERQLEEYLEHCDWFIRGIYNKKGESKVDIYDKTNNIVHQVVKNTLYHSPLSEEEKVYLDELMATNIIESVVKPIYNKKSYNRTNGKNNFPVPATRNYLYMDDYFDDADFEEELDRLESFASSDDVKFTIY